MSAASTSLQGISEWLATGGILMPAIAVVAFLIWYNYLAARLKIRNLKQVSIAEKESLQSIIDHIRVLVAAAPLLGLLGTVLGMIRTFQALTTEGSELMGNLATGIRTALYTTQAGLVAALPGMVALVHLGHIMQHCKYRETEA